MRLFHVTPKCNLESIGKKGIDPQFSRGARNECWFVLASKIAWAVLHVMRKNGINFGDVAVLEVLIPQSRIRRRGRGIYSSSWVVPPLYMTDYQTGDDVATLYPE